MAGFNIEPNDLQGMISKLNNYSTQLNTVSLSMNSYARQLNSTWKDPQYQSFISAVDSMSKSLKANQEQLSQLARQLVVLKQNLERTRSDYNRMRTK